MSAEKIFSLLRDEAWHSITDLSRKTRIEADKLIEYSRFLAQQGIVKYEDQNQRVKIEPEWNRTLPDEDTFV